MNEPTIICPSCSEEIKLNESLAGPLVAATKKEFQRKLDEQQLNAEQNENILKEKLSKDLETERLKLAKEADEKARRALSLELEEKGKEASELKELLQQREAKLTEAQKAQAEFIKKQRELEEQKREFELTVEKRIQESQAAIKEKAMKDAEEGLKLKISEKEQTISAMQKKVEELQRRAEQGSQQLQGEVLELELESLLSEKFPLDNILPVPKGEFGGDVIQEVLGLGDKPSGKLLWEMKRTKNWSDGWLTKLRGDQRAAHADLAIIVSHTLPKDIETFGIVDSVWVTAPRYTIPLAIALRQSVIEVSNTRMSQEGQETKMELVYEYLTGPKFRHRIEAIVEKFDDMQSDLEKERKMMTRQWAKRQLQIEGVIGATVGLHGDLQGIAGKAIQEIDSLEMAILEHDGENNE